MGFIKKKGSVLHNH